MGCGSVDGDVGTDRVNGKVLEQIPGLIVPFMERGRPPASADRTGTEAAITGLICSDLNNKIRV